MDFLRFLNKKEQVFKVFFQFYLVEHWKNRKDRRNEKLQKVGIFWKIAKKAQGFLKNLKRFDRSTQVFNIFKLFQLFYNFLFRASITWNFFRVALVIFFNFSAMCQGLIGSFFFCNFELSLQTSSLFVSFLDFLLYSKTNEL